MYIYTYVVYYVVYVSMYALAPLYLRPANEYKRESRHSSQSSQKFLQHIRVLPIIGHYLPINPHFGVVEYARRTVKFNNPSRIACICCSYIVINNINVNNKTGCRIPIAGFNLFSAYIYTYPDSTCLSSYYNTKVNKFTVNYIFSSALHIN